MNNVIITAATAPIWADIYAQIKVINNLSSVDEFYGIVDPITGVEEVYDRLHGWRKEVYKNFLMSGWFEINQFGDKMVPNCWGYGRYSVNSRAWARVRKYPANAHDWAELEEEFETSLSWREVCKLYSF